MTAKEAIVILCELYKSELLDKNGNLKLSNKLIEQWLQENIQEKDMNNFIKKVLLSVKTEYKQMPSLATMNELLHPTIDKDALEIIATQKFDEMLEKVNIYRDFVTDDSRVQAGLNAIGGWRGFCNSLTNELKWLRKSFIKAFVQEEITPLTPLKRFYGIGTTGKYRFIGNAEKCKQIADGNFKDNKIQLDFSNINKFQE